ncbi:hypothetical protein GIB67_035609 [Kingdonia uniflora]|uniref:Uncharacterized protein n=1 Tax=Kingdonia uniflora TaxID=39325 RepID=A0A7J7LKK7_9MAGN|nr:hypothetical protein GIB67_035609 [Kingdonia uniflora]
MVFDSELVLLPAIVLISLRTSLGVLCVLEAWSLSTVIVIGGCLECWILCGSVVSPGLLVVDGGQTAFHWWLVVEVELLIVCLRIVCLSGCDTYSARIYIRLGCSWGESVDSPTCTASDLVIGQATDYWILGRDIPLRQQLGSSPHSTSTFRKSQQSMGAGHVCAVTVTAAGDVSILWHCGAVVEPVTIWSKGSLRCVSSSSRLCLVSKLHLQEIFGKSILGID